MVNRSRPRASAARLLAALARRRSRRVRSALARALLRPWAEPLDPFERAERELDRQHPGWRSRSSPTRPAPGPHKKRL